MWTQTPSKSESVAFRKIGSETALVPVANEVGDLDSLLTLNETGSFIWGAIDGSTTLESILGRLLDEFDVDEAKARSDIEGFISELMELDLIAMK